MKNNPLSPAPKIYAAVGVATGVLITAPLTLFLIAVIGDGFTGQKVAAIATVANTVLTCALVVITAYYAILTSSYVQISNGMAREMKNTNWVNFRPMVWIGELSIEQLRHISASDHRNCFTPTSPAYAFLLGDGGGAIVYSVTNISSIPARNLKHHLTVEIIDPSGGESAPVEVDQNTLTVSEVLLPRSSALRTAVYPPDLIIAQEPANKHALITIRVTYEGYPELDANRYYFTTILKSRVYRSIEEMNLAGFGSVITVKTDEGVYGGL